MPAVNFFYLGLSLLLIHEMDAIRCKEWRILPFLSQLNDDLGERIFIFLHIPLFYFLLLAMLNAQQATWMYGLDWFFIIHLGLHILFIRHPKNEFKDWISWMFIIGPALCGALDLMVQ